MTFDSVITVRPGGTVPAGGTSPAGAVKVYDPPGQTRTVTGWQPGSGGYERTLALVETDNQYVWFYRNAKGDLENRPLDPAAPGLVLLCSQA